MTVFDAQEKRRELTAYIGLRLLPIVKIFEDCYNYLESGMAGDVSGNTAQRYEAPLTSPDSSDILSAAIQYF